MALYVVQIKSDVPDIKKSDKHVMRWRRKHV